MKPKATTEEIWKPIPHFLGYEVSNHGRVRSFKRRVPRQGYEWTLADEPQRILSPSKGRYKQVVLCYGKKRYQKKVATLVLEAFVGPCPEGMEVCHNDCNPHNNYLNNLRYDTPMGNHADGCGIHAQVRLTNKQAYQVRLAAKEGIPDAQLAELFGTSSLAILNCRLGHTYKSAGGPKTAHTHSARGIRLADSEVQQLREIAAIKGSLPLAALAEQFQISESYVSLLLRGLRRKIVDGPILKSVRYRNV